MRTSAALLVSWLAACSGSPAPEATAPAAEEPAPPAPPQERELPTEGTPLEAPPIDVASLTLDAQSGVVGACEICIAVVENHDTPPTALCRAIQDPVKQKNCVALAESLGWWLTQEVYWMKEACLEGADKSQEWVRPCPAHAICSWKPQPVSSQGYCPADPLYPSAPPQPPVD